MRRKSTQRGIGKGFQRLGHRLLMAGDVDVSFVDNDLHITGDWSSNQVEVSTVDGQLQVTGVSTTINNRRGAFVVDADRVDDVIVRMGRGNDRVMVDQVHLNNTSHSRLSIHGGNDDDVIGVYNSSARDLMVDGFSGDDHVIVSMSAFGRDIDIDLDSGNDELDLYAAYAGDDIRIDGGSGNDDLAVQWSNAADDLVVDLGDHDDVLWIYGGQFGDVNVFGDSGNDRAKLQNVDVTDDLYAHMGSGDDRLYLYGVDVADGIGLDGGSGNDSLSASGNNFNAGVHNQNF